MTAIALTIAGSDSGGGAGIQADLKTFSALGVYGCSVITALTAQNTQGVQGIFPVDPAFVRQQIDSVFGDIAVGAVKIGMLGTPEVIAAVADGLAHWRPRWVVLDPVMVAKGGDKLLRDEAVAALRERLLPLASLIIEPAKVLFLNNAINHGVLTPLGINQSAETGQSILFLLEANPGPGVGLLIAYSIFGTGLAKSTAPAAAIIQFFGGIHEIYFPYVLMKPAA